MAAIPTPTTPAARAAYPRTIVTPPLVGAEVAEAEADEAALDARLVAEAAREVVAAAEELAPPAAAVEEPLEEPLEEAAVEAVVFRQEVEPALIGAVMAE